ncbi:phosphopantetheine-binding protein [Streptomyces sp. NPDC048638]|uniref:acyl carrier protein n=1 Tax=Streptomyces sp. NPDC048638 TaxID=3365580 RepID=UPI003710438F
MYSPQLGRYVRNADDVLALLEGMLLLPVQFRPALNTLYDDGADTFIECGAKQVLSDIVPECLPKAARAVPGLTGRAQAGSAQQLVETVTTKPVHGPQPRPAAKQPAPTAPAPPERDVAEPLTPAPPPPEASHNGSADGLPAESVLRDEIRAVYAEILQYPADVIEDDVALEAELGVSSLKQTQAFVRLLDKFELSTPSSDVRIFDYRTVADISTLLRQLADAR